jgi:hypothetical protein
VVSRQQLLPDVEREVMSAGALRGAGSGLLITSMIGGSALLLELMWPWLAWGYVGVALVLGLALQAIASRGAKALEHEVERLRQQHRSD